MAHVDMWGFLTIKTVEEKAIRAWDIGNCRHAIRLEVSGERKPVAHSIADLTPMKAPYLGKIM
jgi:hypothetical protein